MSFLYNSCASFIVYLYSKLIFANVFKVKVHSVKSRYLAICRPGRIILLEGSRGQQRKTLLCAKESCPWVLTVPTPSHYVICPDCPLAACLPALTACPLKNAFFWCAIKAGRKLKRLVNYSEISIFSKLSFKIFLKKTNEQLYIISVSCCVT